jgi:CRISPR-associated protein Cas2
MAYHITDPKRLRRICRLMVDHRYRLQYSVFVRDLPAAELAELESTVRVVMDLRWDSVIRIDLGAGQDRRRITAVGRPRTFPPDGAQIVQPGADVRAVRWCGDTP